LLPVADVASAPLKWIKATRSYGCGECVELAAADNSVLVRDSKDTQGPHLRFAKADLAAFLASARAGTFDHLL
jgi:Domain of unknown function (DUF397)